MVTPSVDGTASTTLNVFSSTISFPTATGRSGVRRMREFSLRALVCISIEVSPAATIALPRHRKIELSRRQRLDNRVV